MPDYRKMQLASGAYRLFGQHDTGTVAIAMPRIAEHYDIEVIDDLGNLLATADGSSYDPNNSDPF